MRRKIKSRKELCGNPDCRSRGSKQVVHAVGLCCSCYRMMRRLIVSGQKTVKDFEERGFIARKRVPGESRFPDLVGSKVNQPHIRQVRGVALK